MADWDTSFKDEEESSMKSSESGGLSTTNKENVVLHRIDSEMSTEDSERELILNGGGGLREESSTEYVNISIPNGHLNIPQIPPRNAKHPMLNGTSTSAGTAKARAAKSPFAPSTIDSIAEEKVAIPSDGNLSTFTPDQMANFFRCLKIDDRIISHLHRKNVDGKRFSRLKDSELDAVGMKENPVILFFKEKSSVKVKKGSVWRL